MKAVVMAGGEGTRLRPLTGSRPKPMIPVANKPVMEHIINLLKRHGITEIIVTLQYMAEAIQSYFGDGADLGVNITYSIEETPLGTAGSVKKIEEYLDDTFIVISGDALIDIDLTEIIEFHNNKASMATITLVKVESPLEYGVVITTDDGKIRRFLEKPSWGEVFSDLVNTGIYVLEPEIFKYMKPGRPYDFSKDIYPLLLQNRDPLYGFVANGYWCDVGSLQLYLQANYDVLLGKVEIDPTGNRMENSVWVGEGTTIHPTAEINGPVIIGDNCEIRKGAKIDPLSVLGDNVVVVDGATIERSIIFNNAYIGEKTRISGAIIGKQCSVKYSAVVAEGAIVSDDCTIGSGSLIKPNVKIWPGKVIEGGATVTNSIVWGEKCSRTLFSASGGMSGLTNIEMTPEFATRLGAAYGTSLPKGSTVILSRDNHPASRMIKRSIISGLISSGINCSDIEQLPSPITRSEIKAGRAKGGIHVRISPFDPDSLDIKFFDINGMDIDKNTERKIENIFFREDFRKANVDEIGSIYFPPRVLEYYTTGFFKAIDRELVAREKFKVVIDYSYGSASLIFPSILGKLGCEVVGLNAYMDPKKSSLTPEEFNEGLRRIANITQTLNADLGVFLDSGAEKMALINKNGQIMVNDDALLFMSLLVFRTEGKGKIAVPVSATRIIDDIARKYDSEVIRTRVNARAIMEASTTEGVIFGGDGRGGFIFPRVFPAYDAMLSFAKVLELMARSQVSLSELGHLIPPINIVRDMVQCPWELKGKVMRVLMEETKNQQVELIDGVKIFRDGGWVLVLPDSDSPYFHIYAEADSWGQAEGLARYYKELILKAEV